jgi:Uma2 family endonuclease
MQTDSPYVTEIATLFPVQGRWTERDYFSLPEASRIIELSEGELTLPPNPTFAHQRATARLGRALMDYADKERIGEAIAAPFSLRLREGKLRQPDVLLIRAAHLGRVKETYIEGGADWVAEVISPSTRRTDSEEKAAEYAEAGIPEYWLIDLEAGTITVFTLSEGESQYGSGVIYEKGQQAHSLTLAGFKVQVDEVIGGQG